jgi:hypothetical protein
MRYLIVAAAAAAIMVFGSAHTQELGAKIAMGPTSAAHFPSGQQRSSPSPSCKLPDDKCHTAHNRSKHRHTKPKHPHGKHFKDQ